MPHPQEFHLAGRHATLRAVTDTVNRHLRAGSLRRVEVRYSRSAELPFDAARAKASIAEQLREHGLAAVAVSVRPIETAIDDALGEHVVRLIHDDPPPGRTRAPWWQRYMRWLPGPLRHRIEQRAADGGPSSAAAEPPVERRKAVALLQAAVRQATRADGPRLSAEPIAVLAIRVRHAGLHQTLQPLLRDPADAARWAAGMLQGLGHPLASALAVHYTFASRSAGDGTELAGGSDDIEVHVDTAVAPAAECSPHGTLAPRVEVATLMPEAPPRATPVVALRVLGTTERRFDAPFEIAVNALPVRFDRALLDGVGFARLHNALARVASQSCPLTIDRGAHGGLVLQAGPRRAGSSQAMYFEHDSGAAVLGRHALADRCATVVVNGPAPMRDLQSGELLHPLLLEIALDGGREAA